METATTSDDLRACARLHNVALPWTPMHGEEITRVLAGGEQLYGDWLLARDDLGQPVGAAWWGDVLGSTAVGVVVDPAHRGRGVGTSLLEAILERSDAALTCFRSDWLDPATVALARRFGFQAIDEPEPSHWRSTELIAAACDVEVLTTEHLADGAFVDVFSELAAASVEDMPGEPPPSRDDNVRIEQRRLEAGGFTVLVRNEQRALVACATASAAPWSPWLTSDHTLVLPEHRGRGHGIAAKRAQHAVAQQRGYERVVTDVRPDNARMLAILRRLGYESVPTPTLVRH